jgi:hypothetical protein
MHFERICHINLVSMPTASSLFSSAHAHALRLGCGPLLAALLAVGALLQNGMLHGEPVSVRHTEGVVHGFLALRAMEGTHLADGELSQFARGERVTSRIVFHFKDGSLHDETVVYSQRGTFRLLSDHLVQRGPAFPSQRDIKIDAVSGQVNARYTDEDGKEKVVAERLELPEDVANGLPLTLIKNLPRGAQPVTVSFVTPTPKPGLVKVEFVFVGEEPFSIGTTRRTALHYVLKVKLQGVARVIAPLLNKKPADYHVWIVGGEAPGFVKLEGPLFPGGPIWRIELASPVWRANTP